MAVVNKCGGNGVASNKWCIKTLFAVGEGTDAIALPVDVWALLKERWMGTVVGTGETPPMVLSEDAASSLQAFIYNAPTGADAMSVLFPDADTSDKLGLYFVGNSLIFNPTVGNAIESDGVPYQNSTFSLPIGSNRDYDELMQYMQSKAWILLKLSANGRQLHAYGGPRGYISTPDQVAEMVFSGNNDAKGKTQAQFSVDKANYTIEYVSIGTQTTDKNALKKLFDYIKTGACKENGEVVAD